MPVTPNLNLTYPMPLDPATADLWGDIINDVILGFDGEFGTRTINQNFADKVLSRPVLKDYGETLATVTSSGGTATFNFENGNHQQITLTENTTIAFSNPPATGTAGGMLLYIKQHASSAKTLSWPASVKWAGSVTPTMTTTLGRTDEYMVITRDGGSTYSGSVRGQNFNI